MIERCWPQRCPSLAAVSALCLQPVPLVPTRQHVSTSALERPPQSKTHAQHLRASAASPAAAEQVSAAGPDVLHICSQHPSGGHDSRQPLLGADLRPVTTAYVHLPFCKRKCFYCDFPVVAVGAAGGDSPAAANRFSDYLSLLLRELAATRRVGPRAELSTVFFGGGTPSLIPPAQLGDVLDALRVGFGIAEGAEISMEADPGRHSAHFNAQQCGVCLKSACVHVNGYLCPCAEQSCP